jgi:hypothetical protein
MPGRYGLTPPEKLICALCRRGDGICAGRGLARNFPACLTGDSRMKKTVSALALALVCFAMSGEAHCSTRHFKATQQHFTAFSSEAAALFFKTDNQRERNILSHLTATSAIYADKALMVAYLVDILQNMESKPDKAYVERKLKEFKSFLLLSMPPEIKSLSEMVDSLEESAIRAVGDRIVNEMRVFERNAGNL